MIELWLWYKIIKYIKILWINFISTYLIKIIQLISPKLYVPDSFIYSIFLSI